MADIVTFDPVYFQELAKELEGASRSLNDAKADLQKASVGLDSGLVAFALCSRLNDDIRKIRKTSDGFINEANEFSKILIGGAMRVNGWEATTKNSESGLASQLGKTWGFENANWSPGGKNSSSGAPAQPGPSEGSTLAGQEMNSKYYTQNLPGVPRTLINSYDGKEHMNCVYYARSRAMEANGLDSYAPKGSGSTIQPNSIAHFPGHDVFIEEVKVNANGEQVVVFSESNWGGAADGHRVEMPYDEFVNRGGSNVNGYTYF